ncbi:MAG: imidazoleglycerol-phosphate dehydratase HisB [Desulfofustis sp.]|nr:imidazoleglycerol-phosphate dehydratase HisB [Desulfofustis sp.]
MTTAGKTRVAEIQRRTAETDISLSLVLDGTGMASIDTGVGFLNHMLTLFTVHGGFDLSISARGDLDVDDHHTVEDVGICLGQAFSRALGDKGGIRRYGSSYVPMDETLARVVIDFSNRPYLYFGVDLPDRKVGTFDTALAKEFLRALALHGGITMHVDVLHGENAHHIIEAVFKATARAMADAAAKRPGDGSVLSSKGAL